MFNHLTQIIETFRIPNAKIPSTDYPFQKEAIEEIVALTSPPLPRNLLTACRRIFTRAAADDQITSLTDEISTAYVTANF